MCGLAIELGATFVAQSFSGDKAQLVPLLQAAMSHEGFALVNVLSPCVTFNNNTGSTKSYDYVREHLEATASVDFVPYAEEITTQYEEGETKSIQLHDGSWLELHKLAQGWNPEDKISAINALQNARKHHEILTGLIYLDTDNKELHDLMNTTDVPLNKLTQDVLCPGLEVLESINADLR